MWFFFFAFGLSVGELFDPIWITLRVLPILYPCQYSIVRSLVKNLGRPYGWVVLEEEGREGTRGREMLSFWYLLTKI